MQNGRDTLRTADVTVNRRREKRRQPGSRARPILPFRTFPQRRNESRSKLVFQPPFGPRVFLLGHWTHFGFGICLVLVSWLLVLVWSLYLGHWLFAPFPFE